MKLMTKKMICVIFSLSFVCFGVKDLFAVSLDSRQKKEGSVIKEMEKENNALMDPKIASNRYSIQYRSGDMRDPFVSQISKKDEKSVEQIDAPPLPQFTVQGLIWGGVLPQAIINNKVYKVGDTIEEARITDISREGIKVYFHRHEYTVPAPVLLGAKGSNNT
ncbi:MAG: hypothetical protein NTZ63_04685 [Candidatus Omnitrophica bacterium]|nr:hypothetical protein [Candidatus Omnitrophota bacterium]